MSVGDITFLAGIFIEFVSCKQLLAMPLKLLDYVVFENNCTLAKDQFVCRNELQHVLACEHWTQLIILSEKEHLYS
jgi:hypothetical protein